MFRIAACMKIITKYIKNIQFDFGYTVQDRLANIVILCT